MILWYKQISDHQTVGEKTTPNPKIPHQGDIQNYNLVPVEQEQMVKKEKKS